MEESPSHLTQTGVQAEIGANMGSDKKTLLAEADSSAKRNLLSVGGHTDTPVDLIAVGNADAHHPCLINGHTVLIR